MISIGYACFWGVTRIASLDGLIRTYERVNRVNNIVLVLLYIGVVVATFTGRAELIFGLIAMFMLVLILTTIQNGTLDVLYAIKRVSDDDLGF